MQEIINCLIEEVNRCRGLAKIPGIETFRDEYLHKADLMEKAAEIVKQVAAICPHGRLIDADALMAEFEKAENAMERHGREFAFSFISSGQEISTEWFAVETMVEDAPTIIPAEESE